PLRESATFRAFVFNTFRDSKDLRRPGNTGEHRRTRGWRPSSGFAATRRRMPILRWTRTPHASRGKTTTVFGPSRNAAWWLTTGQIAVWSACFPRWREWNEQVEALRRWEQFQQADFLTLKARYGVDWVVLQQPGAAGLVCPYRNERVLVCRGRL